MEVTGKIKVVGIHDRCRADADELREIADYFALKGDKENAAFLRQVASRHEVLAGAYVAAAQRAEGPDNAGDSPEAA